MITLGTVEAQVGACQPSRVAVQTSPMVFLLCKKCKKLWVKRVSFLLGTQHMACGWSICIWNKLHEFHNEQQNMTSCCMKGSATLNKGCQWEGCSICCKEFRCLVRLSCRARNVQAKLMLEMQSNKCPSQSYTRNSGRWSQRTPRLQAFLRNSLEE